MGTPTTIDGRFELVARIAVGNMAEVHRGRDRETGRAVAVKLLSAAQSQRFAREAQALIDLAHPHIVRYVAHGVSAGGAAWLATEWVEGRTLAERLRDGALSVAETVRLVERVAGALAAAHARGIVHRDVKPHNLLLPDGEVDRIQLLDFGIARVAGTPAHATLPGSILGTPGYMAPEQVRDSVRVDARADVFALGCVAFECLVGRPLFAGAEVMACLAKVLLEEPPPLRRLCPSVSPTLERLVAAMLHKDPARRPADGAAVAAALAGELLSSRSTPAPATRLTSGEQRLLSIILVANTPGPIGDVWHATAALSDGAATVERAALGRDVGELVAAYGGEVDVLFDCSLVVTFSGHGVATDQALQASRCALALRARLPSARLALATGRGLLVERWSTGEVIDRAGGLLARAGETGVRIDEITAELVREARDIDIVTDDGGLVLVAARAARPARAHVATTLVGRSRELATLGAMLDECVAEPTVHLALVTGPAGIGKSRLLAEFCGRVNARGGLTLLGGRGDSLHAGAPFAILSDALRREAGFADGDHNGERWRKLRTRVARHLGGDEVERIVGLLGQMVGLSPSEEASRAAHRDPILVGDQMRAAWLSWIDAECAARPLVLVLEDFHWGDRPTAQLIEAALRDRGRRPLFVLALARLDIHDLFPGLWRSCGMQELRLGPLGERASRELVAELAGAAATGREVATTPAVIERIVAQGGGNPFFLEQLVRAAAAGQTEAPATLKATLQARLGRLPPEPRRVMRAASVFGQRFTPAGVAALVGDLDGAEIDRCLAELVDEDEIVAEPRGAGYTFRHALVREAAYDMLLDPDRRLGHRLAGAWLARTSPDTEPLTLAEHCERGGALDEAVVWYERAVEQSLEGNDLVAAIERAERALGGGARGPLLGSIRRMQAEAHWWRGEHAAAERAAAAALAHLPPGETRSLTIGLHADASGKLGDRERLVALAGELRAGLQGSTDVIAAVRLSAQLLLTGQRELADLLLSDAVRLNESLAAEDPALRAWLAHGHSVRALYAGDLGTYVELKARTVALFGEARDARNECVQRVRLGYAYAELGAYPTAEASLREAMEVARRMGLHQVVALAQHNLGAVLLRRGALAEAEVLEREAAEFFARHGDRRLECASRVYLSTIALRSDDLAAAETLARQALGCSVASSPAHAHALVQLSAVLRRGGRAGEALPVIESAIALHARLRGMDEGESQLWLEHAEALLAVGDAAAGRAALALARRRLSERAARILDPHWRKSFLDSVEENARTLTLAAAHGAAPAAAG